MNGTRALLALVIVMGVLIVAGTTGLVAVVVHRLAHPQRPAIDAAGERSVPPVPGGAGPVQARQLLAHEPPGTRITGLVRQSDALLSIALTGGGPDRILVWDLAHAAPLTEIELAP